MTTGRGQCTGVPSEVGLGFQVYKGKTYEWVLIGLGLGHDTPTGTVERHS